MRRLILIALLLLGFSLLLPRCLPISVSPECRARISDCLKSCEGHSPPPPVGEHTAGWQETGVDIRDTCERHCHGLCH